VYYINVNIPVMHGYGTYSDHGVFEVPFRNENKKNVTGPTGRLNLDILPAYLRGRNKSNVPSQLAGTDVYIFFFVSFIVPPVYYRL